MFLIERFHGDPKTGRIPLFSACAERPMDKRRGEQSYDALQAQLNALRSRLLAAKRRARRQRMLAGNGRAEDDSSGALMAGSNPVGMPGLRRENVDGVPTWRVSTPTEAGGGPEIQKSIDGRAGEQALRAAIRYRLTLSPRLPLNEDQWTRIVCRWSAIAGSKPFDVDRLIACRSLGSISVASGTVQAVYEWATVAHRRYFAPGTYGSLMLAKLCAWSWLEDEALARQTSIRPRRVRATKRGADPTLPCGVLRKIVTDPSGSKRLTFRAAYRDEAGKWRNRSFSAGRIDGERIPQEATARRAAIAYRKAWENQENGKGAAMTDVDWHNWRHVFAAEG